MRKSQGAVKKARKSCKLTEEAQPLAALAAAAREEDQEVLADIEAKIYELSIKSMSLEVMVGATGETSKAIRRKATSHRSNDDRSQASSRIASAH